MAKLTQLTWGHPLGEVSVVFKSPLEVGAGVWGKRINPLSLHAFFNKRKRLGRGARLRAPFTCLLYQNFTLDKPKIILLNNLNMQTLSCARCHYDKDHVPGM